MRRIAAVWISSVVMFSFVVITVDISEPVRGATTIFVDDSGGADYTTINEALFAASDGDTIYVYSGTYNESLLITKIVSLVGENRYDTIINGSGTGSVVIFSEPWINITGFTIKGSGNQEGDCGIMSQMWTGNCTISDNIISHNNDGIISQTPYHIYIYNNNVSNNMGDGVTVSFALESLVIGNTFYNNVNDALYFGGSDDNIVADNTFISNSGDGLYLSSSNRNTIVNNNFISNYETGVYLDTAHENNIENNTFNGNGFGISTWESVGNSFTGNAFTLNIDTGINLQTNSDVNFVSDNTFLQNGYGITLLLSVGNNITGNDISDTTNIAISLQSSDGNAFTYNNCSSNTGNGFDLQGSNGNNLSNNIVMFNGGNAMELVDSNDNNASWNTISSTSGIGLYIWSSNDNILTYNELLLNDDGVYITMSSNNLIHHNNIIDNNNQAFDNGNNQWDDGYPSGGNYWSDWTSPDDYSGPNQDEPGNDGIVDEPYVLSSPTGRDNYPFTTQSGWLYPPETGPVHNTDTNERFDTIQDAIDDEDTLDGHTIEVASGTYCENVVVNKALTLIGEDKNTTIIDGGENGDVVGITADWVNITGFTIKNSRGMYPYAGIHIDSNYTAIYDNNVSNNMIGMYFYSSHDNTISYNNASSNVNYGIYLYYSDGNNVLGNTANLNNQNGFHILYSHGNEITDNVARLNAQYGIHLGISSGNELRENTVSSNSWDGIDIYYSDENTVTGNTISSNGHSAIHQTDSIGNTYKDNTMTDGGINMYGDLLEHWDTHDIDVTNRVNDEPVYYWKNQTGGTIPSPAGQIILANCINVTIEAQNLTNISVGIELGFSANNIITDNNLSENKQRGIYMYYSDNNYISDNLFVNNYYGIYLSASSNNQVYHNNFISNSKQAYDDQSDNIWNYEYPYGGNYWSDYTGMDEYGGPNQDQPGGDGIGDTPYVIDTDSQDSYPLLVPWEQDFFPPEIDLINPQNNTVIKAGTVLNISVSDTDIYQVGYSLNGGPEQTLAPPYDIDTTDWADACYILGIHAFDTHSNENTRWFNITIDSTLPSIVLNSPQNRSFIAPNVEINLTVSDDNLDRVSYIENDKAEQSLFFPYNIETDSWDDGEHVIEVTAEDLAGNIRKVQYAFTKDTIPPGITLNSPENNSVITDDEEINVTIADEDLDEVLYRINNDTYQNLHAPYSIATMDWKDGIYIIDIIASDMAGNVDMTRYVFIKDTVWPEITLNSPDNNTLLIEASTLDFDISDDNLDSITYSINQGSFLTLDEPYDIDISDWNDNVYEVNIRAEDIGGHVTEEMFMFWIDNSPPSITITSPVNGGSDVDIDGMITIEFSEPMDCASVESALSITPDTEFTCTWTHGNKTLTLNFSEPLEYDTQYQISIGSKAKDTAGRDLDEGYDFGFTTAGKSSDDEGFPMIFLMALVVVMIIAVIIAAVAMSKRKKKSGVVSEVQAAPMESPQPIQVTCPSCGNLLSVNDIGTTMNVSCPFCSQVLTVQSQRVAPPMAQPQPQPIMQPSTMKISCPQCGHAFEVQKTGGPTRVQCPNCGISGTMNT